MGGVLSPVRKDGILFSSRSGTQQIIICKSPRLQGADRRGKSFIACLTGRKMRGRIKRSLCSAVILLIGIFLFAGSAQGKPEFSASTGLGCGACHIDPVKGGTLNAHGEKYRAAGYRLPGAGGSATAGIQLLKFLLGSIHILFAFVWFGPSSTSTFLSSRNASQAGCPSLKYGSGGSASWWSGSRVWPFPSSGFSA